MKRLFPEPDFQVLKHENELDILRPCDRCGRQTSLHSSMRDYDHTFCECFPCFQLTHPRMWIEIVTCELIDGEYIQ